MSIGCVWVGDAFGVVDPPAHGPGRSAGQGPVAAGFVVARSGASRVASLRAWRGWAQGSEERTCWLTLPARAAGTLFTNPNVSAAVLVGIVPLSLYLEARRDQVIAAALCLGWTGRNGLRGGMLAALIMVGVYVISQRGDRRAWLAALLALAVDGAFHAAHRLARLAEDPHAHGRAMGGAPHGRSARTFPPASERASLVGMASSGASRPTVRSTVTCEAKPASRLTASGFSSSSITALWVWRFCCSAQAPAWFISGVRPRFWR